MQLVTKLYRVDFAEEHERATRPAGAARREELLTREMRVTNPQIIGKTFDESLLTELTGMVFTRVKRGRPDRARRRPSVVLQEGGRAGRRGLARGGAQGRAADRPDRAGIGGAAARPSIEYRDLVVINRKVVGIDVVAVWRAVGHPVIVSRIRRGGVHITPHPGTTLELGDQIRVVTHRDDLERVDRSSSAIRCKDISEADFLSFSLGLVLGVAVGMIPIPFLGGHTLRLGFAGGPLDRGADPGAAGAHRPDRLDDADEREPDAAPARHPLLPRGRRHAGGRQLRANIHDAGARAAPAGAAITLLSTG